MNHEKKTKMKIPTYFFITEKELRKTKAYIKTKNINTNSSWLGLYEAKVETTVYRVFGKKKKKRQEARERT